MAALYLEKAFEEPEQKRQPADRSAKRAAAEAALGAVRARSRDPCAFGEIARVRSDDPAARVSSGELPFLTRDELTARFGAPVADAAFALGTDGALASPVVVTAGWNDNGCDPAGDQPQKCPVFPAPDPTTGRRWGDTKVRPATYYYHPDHLGSTSWVTDQNGRVHEHVEYFPYGEVWRDPRSDSDGSPVKAQAFLFSGKELDEETGLHYFGARYLDPVRVRWVSADPMLAAYTHEGAPGGGVFNPVNVNVYQYVSWNPLAYRDADGRWGADVHHKDTRDWARATGLFTPEQAETIARADNEVDNVFRGKSWLPNWLGGDQSYHFSTSAGQKDSRLVHFEEHFAEAVKLGREAKSYREKAGDKKLTGTFFIGGLRKWYYQYMARIRERASLVELGTALHPYQGIDAHDPSHQKKNALYYYHDTQEGRMTRTSRTPSGSGPSSTRRRKPTPSKRSGIITRR